MRKGLLIWILVLVALTTVGQRLHAQWEMIGPEGSPDDLFRVDSFLYGTTTYGFYRSSDDGDSWKRLDKGLPQPWNHKYEVKYDGYEFSMPARTFNLAVGDSGFYVLDANDVWSYRDSSYHSLYCSYSTRISLDSFLTIFPVPAIDSSAVYLSTDHGKSWIRRSPPEGLAAHIYYINTRIFIEVQIPYNSTSKLFHSDDYGETWEESSTGWAILGSLKLYNFPTFILAVGSFAGTLRSFRSTDTGNTWSSSTYLDAHPSSVSSVGNDAFAFFYEYAYRTTDSGGVWYPLRTHDLRNMHAVVGNKRGDGYIALVEGPAYESWDLCHLDTGFTIVRHALNQKFTTTKHWLVYAEDNVLIAMGGPASTSVTVFDSAFRSTDNGASWHLLPVHLEGYGIIGSWRRGQQYIYTIGIPDSGHYAIYRSSDHGEHWENVGPRHDSIFFGLGIAAITNDTIVVDLGVSRPTRFSISYDGGTTWGPLLPHLPESSRKMCFLNGYLYDLQLVPTRQLLRSADGIVWGSVDLPDGDTVQFRGIHSGEGVLYITTSRYESGKGTLHTIYRSDDEGASWQNIGDQFDIEFKTAPVISTAGSMTYVLGVNSISTQAPDGFPRLFVSSDRGVTWQRLNNNIPEAQELFVTSSDLFVTSTQGGSYRLSKTAATVRREAEQTDKLVVYPNPVTQELSVTHPPGAYTYSIVSMTGIPLVSHTSQISDHTELNVSDLPAGIYSLRVHNEQISMQTLFVVVR